MADIFVSDKGNDSNDGLSVQSPLRDLRRAAGLLKSGGNLRLHGGSRFDLCEALEFFDLDNITVSSYGFGRAMISGFPENGLLFHGCSDVRFSGLRIFGTGWQANDDGVGFLIVKCNNFLLENTGISGFMNAGAAYHDCKDLTITGCAMYYNGGYGIHAEPRSGYISEHVRITHCKTNNNGGSRRMKSNHSGSGITISYTHDILIEFCEAAGNGWAQRQTNTNGPVGIWCWGNTDKITMRYNIGRHNRTQPGTGDGDGFDYDGGVTNGLMEYNYSYANEAAGYLLCEYGSGMDWDNNNVRACASIGDITRVKSYGAAHYYAPDWLKMTNSVMEKSLLMPDAGAYVVENSWVGKQCEGLIVKDNIFVANGTPAVYDADNPGMEFNGNVELKYDDCMKDPHIPALTDPRVLPELPLFGLLENGRCAEVLRIEGLRGLFAGQYSAGLEPAGYDELSFDMRFDGMDFEGSESIGASLHYDSLKPGTVTRLQGEGAMIKTFIPGADEGKRYIIRVYGRCEDPETAVCLFAHGTDKSADKSADREVRRYFGGSASDYTCVDLPYTAGGSWVETGVRIDSGCGVFYVDRMEVYQTNADAIIPDIQRSFYGDSAVVHNADSMQLNSAGSAIFARVSSGCSRSSKKLTVKVSECKGKAYLFTLTGNGIETQKEINADMIEASIDVNMPQNDLFTVCGVYLDEPGYIKLGSFNIE